MAENKGEQGTGKHPHKSTEEPYPHHEGKTTKHEEEGKSGSHRGGSHSQHSKGGGESESDDLKSREYRDKEGNIHHHTHTAGGGKK